MQQAPDAGYGIPDATRARQEAFGACMAFVNHQPGDQVPHQRRRVYVNAQDGAITAMKRLLALLVLLFVIPPVLAQDDTPSEESVRELVSIVASQELLDRAIAQIDGMLKKTMRETLAGQTATPEQEFIFTESQNKLQALYQAELNREAIEAETIAIYQNTLTQEEVDGLIEFYQSDLGRVVLEKMPKIQNNTTKAIQNRIILFMPQMKKLEQEMVTQLKQTAE
jgi:hypothetical protein